MYHVSYQVREKNGKWVSEVANFDYISENTAADKLATRHGVAPHDIKVNRIEEYNSMSEYNDLLRG
jgi:hypothetical protein